MKRLITTLGLLFILLGGVTQGASDAPTLDAWVYNRAPAEVTIVWGKNGLGISLYEGLWQGDYRADLYGLCLSPYSKPLSLTASLSIRQVVGEPWPQPLGVDWAPKTVNLVPGQCTLVTEAVLVEYPPAPWLTTWLVELNWR